MTYVVGVLIRDEKCKNSRTQIYEFDSMLDVKLMFEAAYLMKWRIISFEQFKNGER